MSSDVWKRRRRRVGDGLDRTSCWLSCSDQPSPSLVVESNTSSSLIPSMASRLSGESGKDESGVLPTAAAEADDGT